MFPRNAATPPVIDLGQILQISDGAIQTTGASVRVRIGAGAWGAGAGTLACDTTSGIWTYAPTQAETNADYFIVGAYKSGCTALSKTVITSESTTSGRVYVQTNGDKTGYSLTQSFPSNFSSLAITAGGAVTVGTNNDKTGYALSASGLASITSWTVGITGNITGNLSGSVGSVTSAVTVGTINTDVITSSALATSAVDKIVDGVWDEVLTGATHNVPTSAGRRLRQLASVIVHSGTAQGPGTGNNQIQLDAGASSTNGAYDPGLVFIETGTGAGQTRLILQYNGTTKVATVDRDWRVNPDNTSEFVILGDAGRESVNEGLAQAATSTTITLNANASSNDDAYNGQLVFIRSGTGQDQIALVEDYVGSTKVATIKTRSVNGQWSVTPDTTSAYVMIPNLTWTIAEMQSGLATSSGVTSAFTEIKGATWSSSTDTLEAIRDASGSASVTIMPLSSTATQRVAGTTITTFIGDRSPITVAVFDSTGTAVNLTTQGDLEVVIERRDGTDLQVIANASITISGASSNQATFTPDATAVGSLGQHLWALRRTANEQVLAHGNFVVAVAAFDS